MKDKLEYVEKLNDVLNENYEKNVIDMLNDIFAKKNYKEYLDIIYMAISSTQMYGFLSYLDENEKKQFLLTDSIRSNTYSGKYLDFYNSGQLSLIKELEKYNKIFFSAPTSFGKTSLVSEYILYNYKNLKNIMFVVPTNSLLEELYVKFTDYNKKYKMNYFVTTRPIINNYERKILFLTPERFLLLMEEIDISYFDLIIMDETYKIVEYENRKVSDFINRRDVRFRKVADIIASSNKKVFFLSPYTYKETDSMKLFLNKFGIKKINREVEYVKQEIIKIDSETFQSLFGSKIKYVKSNKKAVKVSKILLQLINEKNIVYVATYSFAYEIVDCFENDFKIEDDRLKCFIEHLESTYSIENIPQWKIISGLKKGIGIYISAMPRYIKKEIINLFEKDCIHTLLVTTSFTEGVNTNAKNLIFSSLCNGSNNNKLTPIDVLNVSGRAGRFARNSIGKIYCIDDNIADEIKKYKDNNENIIELENYNYVNLNESSRQPIDYEIEMIEDRFLREEEVEQKKAIDFLMIKHKLTKQDLNISLNVSNLWKLWLYERFNELSKLELMELCKSSYNILSSNNDSRIGSIIEIFNFLKKNSHKVISLNKKDVQIDLFPTEKYEIKPFDKNGDFIWGRLYKIYTAGSSKQIVQRNITYISKKFREIVRKYSLTKNNKKIVKSTFKKEGCSWVLRYYNLDNFTPNYDYFYTETFKFISNIIQYRIPFYLTFFISMLKLYIKKNNMKYEMLEKIDVKKISLYFEEGNLDESFSSLLDYGFSMEIMNKIIDNKIKIVDILNLNFDQDIFDEYELLLIKEYANIFKD